MLAVCAGNGSALWLFGSGFTLAALPAESLSETVGFQGSFHELSAQGIFAVQPFPAETCDLTGTMASADSCHLKRVSPHGWSSLTSRQVSPDKNHDLLCTLAEFTALPLDGLDFVIHCPLVRAHGLASGSCSSSSRFASGFLQTPPRGDALAFC